MVSSLAPPLHESSPYQNERRRDLVKFLPWELSTFAHASEIKRPIYVHLGRAYHAKSQQFAANVYNDEKIARLLNERFVCIAVDIDEQNDVHQLFSTAAILLGAAPTLPAQALLTAAGQPFLVTGPLLAHERDGKPGLFELLNQTLNLLTKEPEAVNRQADELHQKLLERFEPSSTQSSVSSDVLRSTFLGLGRSFDSSFYGFGVAPKVAQCSALEFLLRYAAHQNSEEASKMALLSLSAMSAGGFYDQIGGGFFCQSQDRQFQVPHFEKRLGDNAQLAHVYLSAFVATGHAPFRRIASEVLAFVTEQMSAPSGGFFLRMCSAGDSGAYYLWTRKQLKKALGEPAATHFAQFYGVTEDGPLGGASIPSARRTLNSVARELGIDEASLALSLESSRAQLAALRLRRPGLLIDDRAITSDNAQMIATLCRASVILSDERYLEHAERAALRFIEEIRDDSLLHHALGSDRLGLLDDQVHFAQALVELHQATLNGTYLDQALRLSILILKHFAESLPHEGRDPQRLILRFAALGGEAAPSFTSVFNYRPYPLFDAEYGNLAGTMCSLLCQLAALSSQPELRAHARSLILPYASYLRRSPQGACALASAVASLLEPNLVVVLPADQEAAAQILASQASKLWPRALVLASPSQASDWDGALYRAQASMEQWISERDSYFTAILRSRQSSLHRRVFSGRATASGTKSRLARHAILNSAQTSYDGLSLCRVGLGSYRIGLDKTAHADAVRAALEQGANVLDTSVSFALGDSPRLIHEVLAAMIDAGSVARDELFVIAKLGVALGQEAEQLELRRVSLEPPSHTVALQQTAQSSEPSTSLVSEPLHLGAFSLDPDFLSAQITSSLDRLGLDHLELCLLNGPERLLIAGYSHQAVHDALLSAFVRLEQEVQLGRISGYGVYSNALVATHDGLSPLEVKSHLSLDEMLQLGNEAARKATPDGQKVPERCHFRAIECSANLGESKNLEPSEHGLFQFARRHQLMTLVCRPLSVMTGGALLRLAPVPPSPDGAHVDQLSSAKYRVASLEAEFETTFAVQLRLTKQLGSEALLPFSGPVGAALLQLKTREQFEQAESTLITPRLRSLLAQLDRAFSGHGPYQKWRANYIQAVGTYLACLREMCSEKNRQLLNELEIATLKQDRYQDEATKDAWLKQSWPCRAVSWLMDTEHVDLVLVGPRSAAQANELYQLAHEPLDPLDPKRPK